MIRYGLTFAGTLASLTLLVGCMTEELESEKEMSPRLELWDCRSENPRPADLADPLGPQVDLTLPAETLFDESGKK